MTKRFRFQVPLALFRSSGALALLGKNSAAFKADVFFFCFGDTSSLVGVFFLLISCFFWLFTT